MKKLFALVLTLALVFAIAAPAMAASWGDTAPSTPTASTPFGVAITQTMPTQTYASDGITKIYEKFPVNQGVVAGSPVRFVVTYTLPKLAEILAYLGVSSMPADGDIVATLETANISIAAGSITAVNAEGTTVAGATAVVDSDGDITITLPAPTTAAQTFNFVFTGTIVKTAKATIAATYGFEDEIPAGGISKTVNGITYKIDNTSGTLMGITTGTGSTLQEIGFTVDSSKDNLVSATNWVLKLGTVTYSVASKGTVFTNQADGTVYEVGATGYAAIKAAFDTLTGVLGFTQGDKVYFSDSNIVAFFGVSKATPANAEYKPYTSSLTVTDGTSVPNTGDNMSVIGFVMVGLALLATAAVVVKKVRA